MKPEKNEIKAVEEVEESKEVVNMIYDASE